MSGDLPAPGMELTHLLVVSDIERSRTFYRDVLGAEVHREYGGTSVVLRFLDCRAAYEIRRDRGAAFLTPPVEYPWEIRAFFRDPDGTLIEISESRGSA